MVGARRPRLWPVAFDLSLAHWAALVLLSSGAGWTRAQKLLALAWAFKRQFCQLCPLDGWGSASVVAQCLLVDALTTMNDHPDADSWLLRLCGQSDVTLVLTQPKVGRLPYLVCVIVYLTRAEAIRPTSHLARHQRYVGQSSSNQPRSGPKVKLNSICWWNNHPNSLGLMAPLLK